MSHLEILFSSHANKITIKRRGGAWPRVKENKVESVKVFYGTLWNLLKHRNALGPPSRDTRIAMGEAAHCKSTHSSFNLPAFHISVAFPCIYP